MGVKTLHKQQHSHIVLKPVWAYGRQPWVMAPISNIEILESFQSKVLHMIVDAPWYVPNINI
jgi:hypothetical protein